MLGEHLTNREKQVLDLMRIGRKDREIADELVISISTVRKHAENIYVKLGVRNKVAACEATHLTYYVNFPLRQIISKEKYYDHRSQSQLILHRSYSARISSLDSHLL